MAILWMHWRSKNSMFTVCAKFWSSEILSESLQFCRFELRCFFHMIWMIWELLKSWWVTYSIGSKKIHQKQREIQNIKAQLICDMHVHGKLHAHATLVFFIGNIPLVPYHIVKSLHTLMFTHQGQVMQYTRTSLVQITACRLAEILIVKRKIQWSWSQVPWFSSKNI